MSINPTNPQGAITIANTGGQHIQAGNLQNITHIALLPGVRLTCNVPNVEFFNSTNEIQTYVLDTASNQFVLETELLGE